MKNTNKQIINLIAAYDGVEFQYQFEKRLNDFIQRQKTKIIRIEVNNVEILPDLQQLKQVLLSMSKSQLIKSKVFIESELTKNDIEKLILKEIERKST